MIQKTITYYGTTQQGNKVHQIVLTNSNGMEVSLLTYGATINAILVPYKEKKVNVVLGYKDLLSYEKGTSCIGATVGRYANRISKSSFTINGQEYKIPANEGENHLHGTFSRTIFNYSFDKETLELSYTSPDMEEGFPGNLNLKVRFTLTEDNSLKIHYSATTDKTTVLNLTNHSYFNLNGDNGTVLDHTLQLNSDSFTPTDQNSIPTGEIRTVQGTPMDFREEKTIGKDIDKDYDQLKQAQGYDHNYILGEDKTIKKIATLKADKNNIEMDCLTDQCAVQIYSANFLHKDEAFTFQKNGAICLETQHYPDSPNKAQFPTTILNPDETFESTTIYSFRTILSKPLQ